VKYNFSASLQCRLKLYNKRKRIRWRLSPVVLFLLQFVTSYICEHLFCSVEFCRPVSSIDDQRNLRVYWPWPATSQNDNVWKTCVPTRRLFHLLGTLFRTISLSPFTSRRLL